MENRKRIQFDEAQIRREISEKRPGIYEIRILCTDFYSTKLSGYFHSADPEKMIQQIQNWRYPENCCVNFYMTSNPVKEFCEAREQFNDLRKTRIMTQDSDIDRLTWFVLDIDPEHPAGTSATDSEKEAARIQAGEAYSYMETIGFTDPEIVDSGNGFHLKYAIDLDNTAENQKSLESMISDLHKRFPLIDRAVTNPARILKLPGTLAMKGRHTKERPFRMAKIIQSAGVKWKDGRQ